LLEEHLLHHHPELRAPVTDVVLPDDLVPDVGEHVAQRVPDHRRPQMSDVHLLGHVGLRVVHDDPLPARRQPAGQGVDGLRQRVRMHGQVDETRSGNRPRAQIIQFGGRHQTFGDHPRRQAERLGEPEREAGLEVTELGFRCRPQLGVEFGVRRTEGSSGGSGQPRGKDRQQRRHDDDPSNVALEQD
jgi:hypothetical protein